jgi:hypothetical protein
MARLFGPDESYRLVYLAAGTARAQGLTGRLYADANGSTAADVLTEAGAAIAVVSGAAQVTIDAYSKWPRLQFPASGADTIYGSVNGGPIVPLLADLDTRLDANATATSALSGRAAAMALIFGS